MTYRAAERLCADACRGKRKQEKTLAGLLALARQLLAAAGKEAVKN